MAGRKEAGNFDTSTEEKIKIAARTVFQKKGYAATRTRDIAEEAGVNLGLLNYYFRRKEKLFEVIMFETLFNFFQNIITLFNNEDTDFEKKIELLAANYINLLIKEPDIPLFILSEMRDRPEEMLEKLPIKYVLNNSVFVRQFHEKVKAGQIKEPVLHHFLMNFLGMILFPFVAQPLMSAFFGGLTSAQFNQLMQKRKKLIPVWIKAMIYAG
ncbi:MAG: TetR/AcrR family transcriptional regulator [Bacteroidales bacterium]|jgi:AcrR family transcriptional regulator|nr:TetR/AcrR family transcriptional regulator [Bacteroidales bacterium]